MKCPRDGAVMTFIDDGTHMRNRCPGCSGLLLDEAEVAAALGGRKPDAARVAALPASKVACPRDGKAMRSLEHKGVELDLCEACGSLWLDAGELEKVTARESKAGRNAAVAAAALAGGAAVAAAASPAQASAAGSALSGVGDAVVGGGIEIVFELVGEVLGAFF
jgi:Zn-finger nucleic acid-binding protein